MAFPADLLRTQIDYTAWATLRLLDAACELTPEEQTRDFQTADRSVVGALAHIFAGDSVWFARLSGTPKPDFVAESRRDFAALQSEWPPLLHRWKSWATGLTDDSALAQFSYTDLKGRQWTQPVWQLVLHVVNHGTHHRGQVAGFLRSMGRTPPPLDLHYYYRQQ